ncbi:MAG TPA: hypothetical protein V6D08_16640, partial [Candidatus Obscuribacterales bacterium]
MVGHFGAKRNFGIGKSNWFRALISLLSIASFLLCQCSAVMARDRDGGGDDGPGRAAGQRRNIDLDLSSTARTISAGRRMDGVTIDVGGASRTVQRSELLTPAEYVAAMQVMRSGQQSLLIDAAGSAAGGSVNLSAHLNNRVESLLVPAGVTAVHDFGADRTFNLAGNLTNAGALYAISSNPQVDTARIVANNIFNQQNAVLSSVLPAGGLAGFNNVVSSLNLELIAAHDIVNLGTISSSGNLSLTAGGSITNQATVTAA